MNDLMTKNNKTVETNPYWSGSSFHEIFPEKSFILSRFSCYKKLWLKTSGLLKVT